MINSIVLIIIEENKSYHAKEKKKHQCQDRRRNTFDKMREHFDEEHREFRRIGYDEFEEDVVNFTMRW